MKGKLATLAIILLTCLNVATLIYANQAVKNTQGLQNSIENNPSKIVYVQAKDGYTPIKGIDYFDGAAGINSVSFSTTNTTVKEVPLIGETGKSGLNGLDGKDAPYQSVRINKDTGDLESKMSDEKFWIVLITCSELKVECPDAN